MDPYAPPLAPAPFGLNNTGSICYLNGFLQALVSCTAFTRAVLGHQDYLSRTPTGATMCRFVAAALAPTPEADSAAVLHALVADLRARRPQVRFGAGQESASEALIHILDMMEPEPEPGVAPDESPITRLFAHRFRCVTVCRRCGHRSATLTDHAVNFNLFHLDAAPPTSAAEFSVALRRQLSETSGHRCPACADSPGPAVRLYTLAMVPEILFCMFNLYDEYGGAHHARFFPARFGIPALDGGELEFRLVAQVEHSGSLSGGHYWARALRAGDQVYQLNDTGVMPAKFAPTANTYISVYHFAGARPGPQK